MQKRYQQNWIKLGNITNNETNAIDFVEQWIQHNNNLKILNRYQIEKSDIIPPKYTDKTAITYVVRWRKALQKYKGHWQWREVKNYVFVEIKIPKQIKVKSNKSIDKVSKSIHVKKLDKNIVDDKNGIKVNHKNNKFNKIDHQQLNRVKVNQSLKDKNNYNKKTEKLLNVTPIILHGLEQKQTKLYNRRTLHKHT